MKYIILKWYYWLREFGVKGLFIALQRHSNTLEIKTLSSHWYGTLILRNCLSDIEAVNTVMCFHAYKKNVYLEQCKSIIDLGANIGMATKYFRANLPNAKIVAIEPSEQNANIFKENLSSELNAGVVTLVQAAVGVADGIGGLILSNNRFDSFQISENYASEKSTVAVQIVSMKRLASNCEQPIGVKMDIEGSEVGLLEGRDCWIKEIGYLMIEFHDNEQENHWLKTLQSEGWTARKQFDTWHFLMAGKFCSL
jgi:FkbM family methyltransferase